MPTRRCLFVYPDGVILPASGSAKRDNRANVFDLDEAMQKGAILVGQPFTSAPATSPALWL
jgi:hypothetical protein